MRVASSARPAAWVGSNVTMELVTVDTNSLPVMLYPGRPATLLALTAEVPAAAFWPAATLAAPAAVTALLIVAVNAARLSTPSDLVVAAAT
jgi:hypothetical protein